MMSQQQAKQYQRNQDEADRLAMLEKSKNHPFISGLLKHIFGSSKS
ncbi:hypothetical protein [Pantoea sp. PGP6]